MVTLHAYVLRELLKTFALTLVALTALFTMGGGLYNVLRYEGISAGDILGFIPMLIPIVLTLTMPVAALFAASIVYGRLTADNELLACRAAGVNVHRLFLSAILLSVAVAAFSLFFGDLVIPDFIRRLDHFARTNLRDIAYQKIQVKGHIRYERDGERYLLTARNARKPSERALRAQNLPFADGISYLQVEAPVFLHIDDNDVLARYTSAGYGLCQFDARQSPMEVTVYVDEGHDFDLRQRSVHLKRQQLGPITIPLEFPRKPSMVDLATLMRWQRRPWESDKLRKNVEEYLSALIQQRFFEDCARRVAHGTAIELIDEQGRQFQITAATCVEERNGLLLNGARVDDLSGDQQRPLYYEAPLLRMSPTRAVAGRMMIEMRLERAEKPVIEHHPRASDYVPGREKADVSFTDRFLIPDHILADMQTFKESDVFNPAIELSSHVGLADRRVGLQEAAAKLRRKLAALVHFRLGFTASTLVTVLMAAALGVVFRGARALAAFGLACIPFGSVTILMVMARQLGENEGTELFSPLLTWGGLGLVAVVDLLILRLGVRR
ncbi:MAG: LptF/LptG family permease [Planctomycetota bacterium]